LLGAVGNDSGTATEQHPPQPAPIFDVVIDQQRGDRISPDIFDAAQLTSAD